MMSSPVGPYTIGFDGNRPDSLVFIHHGKSWDWFIEVVERENDEFFLSGMTVGVRALWGDENWFELCLGKASSLKLYGNQILVREDFPA